MSPQSWKKASAYIALLPVYALTRVTPRRRKRVVFGSWLGRSYSDNPRHLFEYVVANHGDIDAIWLAGTRRLRGEIRARGYRCELIHSLKGYWVTATAEFAIVSTGIRDVNRYVCPPNLVNLWHGTPLKKIESDSSHVQERKSSSRLLGRIFPFHSSDSSVVMFASSEAEATHLRSAFGLLESAVHVTGLARDDRLFTEAAVRAPDRRRRILYAPTFRDHDASGPVNGLLAASDVIEPFLAENDLELHVRLHPNSPRPAAMSAAGRIVFDSVIARADDAIEALTAADLLITDYSSIYVDYLLTARPVVFLAYDFKEYSRRERDFYFDYLDDRFTPGPKCASWAQVLEELACLLAGSDAYVAARGAASSRFHRYTDGKNCSRVWDELMRLGWGA